jgi:hypothetical protein
VNDKVRALATKQCLHLPPTPHHRPAHGLSFTRALYVHPVYQHYTQSRSWWRPAVNVSTANNRTLQLQRFPPTVWLQCWKRTLISEGQHRSIKEDSAKPLLDPWVLLWHWQGQESSWGPASGACLPTNLYLWVGYKTGPEFQPCFKRHLVISCFNVAS